MIFIQLKIPQTVPNRTNKISYSGFDVDDKLCLNLETARITLVHFCHLSLDMTLFNPRLLTGMILFFDDLGLCASHGCLRASSADILLFWSTTSNLAMKSLASSLMSANSGSSRV